MTTIELVRSIQEGNTWLITGPNASDKEHLLTALAKKFTHEFAAAGTVHSVVVATVSLEAAARLIKEERDDDEGDYVESGKDIGRTAGAYIAEVLPEKERGFFTKTDKNGKAVHGCQRVGQFARLQKFPEVQLCAIGHVLERGLKFLSTGEIRRTLLCRALLSGCRLLLLSEPFAGLDVQSRQILGSFINAIAAKKGNGAPFVLLSLERYYDVPAAVDHVLAFNKGQESFYGSRIAYEKFLAKKEKNEQIKNKHEIKDFIDQLMAIENESGQKLYTPHTFLEKDSQTLIEMKNVNVGWDNQLVLKNINWHLKTGEHTLIRGPNGSGKTTLLELITGDNTQVFANDISLFGRKRGTGETIWELKVKMGIVSYRLHIEYRMLGDTDLEAVIISGFHDSIGLYTQRSHIEQNIARKWLALGGFKERESESFKNLSYGEQRAILILRAAVKWPQLLILDEPCYGLDEINRSKILVLLEKIAATGTTTLLHVTHDPTEMLDCEKHILELQPENTPMYTLLHR